MPALTNSPNHFLASLSADDSALLQPHLKAMDLPQGVVLYSAEDAINRVYFPHSGVVSIVVGLADGQFIEAGMFGRNNIIGGSALLDGPIALNRAIGQAGGSGVAGETKALKGLAEKSVTLRAALVEYEQSMFAHIQQVVACNAAHSLEERLSRWLLQTRDLVQSDDLPLTQEFIAQMLSVQRSSVTLVARRLQEAGLISYRRGRIRVLDAEALHETCCECYDAINAHFLRLTGWTPSFG
jgi:CRP-like cAMP-binding protein